MNSIHPIYLGGNRGFTALPQAGTIVEIAFAYGLQTLPFVRSVLPYDLHIANTGSTSMRWSHSDTSFQEVDESGNWKRETTGDISDICNKMELLASTSQNLKSPKTWIGSEGENALTILSDFMATVKDALTTISSHKHSPTGSPPTTASTISGQAAEVGAEKGRVDGIKL